MTGIFDQLIDRMQGREATVVPRLAPAFGAEPAVEMPEVLPTETVPRSALLVNQREPARTGTQPLPARLIQSTQPRPAQPLPPPSAPPGQPQSAPPIQQPEVLHHPPPQPTAPAPDRMSTLIARDPAPLSPHPITSSPTPAPHPTDTRTLRETLERITERASPPVTPTAPAKPLQPRPAPPSSAPTAAAIAPQPEAPPPRRAPIQTLPHQDRAPNLPPRAPEKPSPRAPVRIEIGTVEIHAHRPTLPAPAHRPARPAPEMSLDAYLTGRKGRT